MSTVYSIVREFVDGINDKIPLYNWTCDDDVERAFAAKSTNQVIRGCVGAIDGIHVKIKSPSLSRDGVKNARRFHVGRKDCFAWNVQAVCDAQKKITMVDVSFPGTLAFTRILAMLLL